MTKNILRFFTEPRLPRRAISIESHHVAVAEAARKTRQNRDIVMEGRRDVACNVCTQSDRSSIDHHSVSSSLHPYSVLPFIVTGAAREPVPPGLIEPRFAEINIKDVDRVSQLLARALEKAGRLNARRWSLAIPRQATRTFIVQLDEAPKSKKELAEVLGWKVERYLEVSMSELTAAFQRLEPTRPGEERYLVSAGVNDVLAAYEAVLARLSIQPGFVVPVHLAETAWLQRGVWAGAGEGENVAHTSTRPQAPSGKSSRRISPGETNPKSKIQTSRRDALLITACSDELTIIFLRGEDMLSIRSVPGALDSLADEVHRTLVYYLDKLAPQAPSGKSEALFEGNPNIEILQEKQIQNPKSKIQNDELLPNVSPGDIRASDFPAKPGDIRASNFPEGDPEPQLETVLLIGAPLSVSDVEASCQTLFPPDCLPAVCTLRDERVPGSDELTLEAIAGAAGLAAMGL